MSTNNKNYMTKTINTLKTPINWLFKQNPFYIAAFFLPLGILFVTYIIFRVFPFGEKSVLALDMNAQYVYYFEYIYDVLRGQESLFYSWSRNLSGEFFGILGYYLASPFNLLVWIFPREWITEGLLTMILVKVGAIGVTTAVYLRRGRGFSVSATLIFSAMYALSAFTIAQTMNPMWLDGVLALPLIVYGIDALVERGRFRLFTIWLAYSFITCFYIGYMLGIFAVLYFVCKLLSCDKSKSDSAANRGGILARVGLFAMSGATAALISSFVLLPVYSSLQLGKLEFSKPFDAAGFWGKANFVLLDLGNKLLPNSYDTVRPEGLPFLYCGVLAVLLAPLFFLSAKEKLISLKKRVCYGVLLLVLVLFMYIAPIDTFMHGMQVPNWLPYRYSFIISFLLVAFGAEVFDKIGEYSRKAIAVSALCFLGLIILLESRSNFAAQLGDAGRSLLDSIGVILPAIILLTIFAVILSLKNAKFFKNKKRAFCILVGTFVMAELLFNTAASVFKQNADVYYSTRDSYVDFIVPMREKVNEIKEEDDGFYRMEKDFFRTVNDPMALNMYGFSHSSSTLNAKTIELIGGLGMTGTSHLSRYSGATPLVDDLFGVKYVFSNEVYQSGGGFDVNDVEVEYNIDALPIAYLTDPALLGVSLLGDPDDYAAQDINVFNRQNRILSAMLGESRTIDYVRLIDRSNVQKEAINLTESTAMGEDHYVVSPPGADGKIKFNIMAPSDGEIFMWLPTNFQRRVNVWVNRTVQGREVNEWKGNYFEADDYCVKSLGYFAMSERFSVTLTLTKDDLFLKDAFFGYVDRSVYIPAIERLHAMNMNTIVTKESPTKIKIETYYDGERLLFTSIPAEPGWTVRVNGERTEYIEVLDSLIGVMLEPGLNIVELSFTPATYPFAPIFSVFGVVVFGLLCLLYSGFKKEGRQFAQSEDDDEDYDYDYVYKGEDEVAEVEEKIEDVVKIAEVEDDEDEDEEDDVEIDDDWLDDDDVQVDVKISEPEKIQEPEIPEIIIEEPEEPEITEEIKLPEPAETPKILEEPELPEEDDEPEEIDSFDRFDDLFFENDESLQSIIEDFKSINDELQIDEEEVEKQKRAELAERQRQAELAAQAERQRQAELAERQRQAELAAQAERQRQAELAERQRQAELAERQRQAELAAQAERQRQAELAEKQRQAELAERQRQAELAERQRQAELAAQQRQAELAERQRQAELAAQQRQAELAAQAERQRQEELARLTPEQLYHRQRAQLAQKLAQERRLAQEKFHEQAFGETAPPNLPPPQPQQMPQPRPIPVQQPAQPRPVPQPQPVQPPKIAEDHEPSNEKQADFLKVFEEIAKMNQNEE